MTDERPPEWFASVRDGLVEIAELTGWTDDLAGLPGHVGALVEQRDQLRAERDAVASVHRGDLQTGYDWMHRAERAEAEATDLRARLARAEHETRAHGEAWAKRFAAATESIESWRGVATQPAEPDQTIQVNPALRARVQTDEWCHAEPAPAAEPASDGERWVDVSHIVEARIQFCRVLVEAGVDPARVDLDRLVRAATHALELDADEAWREMGLSAERPIPASPGEWCHGCNAMATERHHHPAPAAEPGQPARDRSADIEAVRRELDEAYSVDAVPAPAARPIARCPACDHPMPEPGEPCDNCEATSTAPAAQPEPPEEPREDCGRCYRCLQPTFPAWGPSYMILCPDCGNKRCPHATDHLHACTRSNEPDQPGSRYSAPPGGYVREPSAGRVSDTKEDDTDGE